MFDDTLFILLEEYCKGGNIDKEIMNYTLRKYDNRIIKKHGVWLSSKARLDKSINKVTNNKPKGLFLEHIIPVNDRLETLIYLYGYKCVCDKKDLSDFIIKTFYAVFKSPKHEKQIEAYDAEILLPKKYREPNKIKYFNEYSSER